MGRTQGKLLTAAVIVFSVFFNVSSACSQLEPGRGIAGTIRTGEGSTPGDRMRVRLFNPSGALQEQVHTDSGGRFFFSRLAPGEYVIRVDAPGYETAEQKVTVYPLRGFRANVNITLTASPVAGAKPVTGVVDITVPDGARDPWSRAQEELRRGKADSARKLIEKAVKAAPDFAAGHRLLGQLALDAGRLDDAEKAATRALELEPGDAEALTLRGACLNRRSKQADALPLLHKAMATNPNLWRAHFEMAQALFAEKQYAAALPHARKAIDLHIGAFPEGHVVLANTLMNLRQYPEAAQHLARFLELAPNSPSAPPAREVLKKMKAAGVKGTESGKN